jgi:opacity protein-like surface antigen
MKGFFGACCAIVAFTAAGAAHAADAPGFYVGAEAGASFSQSATWQDVNPTPDIWVFGIGQHVNADVGTGAILGLTGGYRFNDMFRADLSFDYRTGYSVSTSQPGNIAIYKANINALTFMANGYVEPVRLGPFKPYVGVGVGAAIVTSSNASAFFIGYTTPDPLAGQTQTNFAWQVSAGIAYEVNDRVAIDLGYRHLDAGDVGVGANIPLGDSATKGSLVTNEVLLGVRYSF